MSGATTASPAGPRVALLTGGTDGIGRATARVLLQKGYRVVVTGRSQTRIDETLRELEGAVPGARVSALLGDLQSMAAVAQIARAFREAHARLDVLLLNANSVTQTYTRTHEGFEANMAIGFLGRALLALELEPLLAQTPGSQVLSVVGLNLARVDFDDLSSPRAFSSMKALGRWQWAVQLFAREFNRRSTVPMNTYMPGLVKTKILANEPQPMRAFVWVASRLMGVSVERAGEELVAALGDAVEHRRRDGYYARVQFKGRRALDERPDDAAKLWAIAARLLAPWRSKSEAEP